MGHVLLFKIEIIKNNNEPKDLLSLAPVSVLPEYQNKGIGKLLISKVLNKAKDLCYNSIIVLGHPEYYPKFCFKKASLWGIKAPFEVSDKAFMAIELCENDLTNALGTVQYPAEFFE